MGSKPPLLVGSLQLKKPRLTGLFSTRPERFELPTFGSVAVRITVGLAGFLGHDDVRTFKRLSGPTKQDGNRDVGNMAGEHHSPLQAIVC
jgi:hypothetical protein